MKGPGSYVSESETASTVALAEAPAKIRWKHKFLVGDFVRAIGGSGSYGRGEVVEVTEDDKYYRVDFGLGFPSLIREENLELRDKSDTLLDLPGSFVPPIVPRYSILIPGKPANGR